MKVSRTSRLDSEFQKEISQIISKELKNRVSSLSAIISVTEVSVAPDLKTAKVYVSIYDTDPARKNNSYQALSENASFIRHLLSQRMRMRTVPVLTFLWDGSMEYGSKIDKILNQVQKDLDRAQAERGLEENNED